MSFLRWWRDRGRQIFRYWDGSKYRCIDPITALLGLQTHPRYNPQVHPALVDSGDQEAMEITCQAVRDVFGVLAFDPATWRGLTVSETLGLLVEFCLYVEALKKSTALPPISPSNSEPTPSGSGNGTIPDTSGSGSTANGPTSATPTT